MNKTFLILAAATLAILPAPRMHAQITGLVSSFDFNGASPTGNVVLGQGGGAATGNANDGSWQTFGAANASTGISTSGVGAESHYTANGLASEAGDGNLQDTFYFSHAPSTISFSVSGLNVNQPYTLVIYASLGNTSNNGALITLSGGAAGSAETLGSSTVIGDHGSTGLGISYQLFNVTPTASTVNFTLTPNSQQTPNSPGAALYSVLQGFQVAEGTFTSAPEPSIYAMLAAGVGGLLLVRRTRRKA